jgi:hypothetical protein
VRCRHEKHQLLEPLSQGEAREPRSVTAELLGAAFLVPKQMGDELHRLLKKLLG